MVEAREGPYTVGLANSFAGNSWRSQMVAELEYAVSQRDDIEELLITNANNDVSAQNSQISDLVASGVDILLVNAASATALNAELERAHEAGVLVVSFDGTATTPAGIRVKHRPGRVRHDRSRVAGRGDGWQRLGDRPARGGRQPDE